MSAKCTQLLAALLMVTSCAWLRAQQAAPVEMGAEKTIRIATFDSGFGGYFEAKAIEAQMRELAHEGYGPFAIAHYEDTTHLPYGEKTPEQIAQFAAEGILTAFHDGAREVYIGCNTASTQFDKIQAILRNEDPSYVHRVHSIIEISVAEVMRTVSERLKSQDVVTVVVLATPATVKSESYPRALAKALHAEFKPGSLTAHRQSRWLRSKGGSIESYTYETELRLGARKRVVIEQLAPANWVEMIENGAAETEKDEAVQRDLGMLQAMMGQGRVADVVGEFCTHYPVLDARIQRAMKAQGLARAETPFVVQGPLVGELFRKQFLAGHPLAGKTEPVPGTPPIYLSGTNIEATRRLAEEIFPKDPAPEIETKNFVRVE